MRFQRWGGARAEYFQHYMKPHLKEERPDEVVLLLGGNNLPTKRDSPTPVEEIADNIIKCGLLCKQYHVKKVYVSSILPREMAYMQARRKKLNDLLSSLCCEHGFEFILNDNIVLSEHIWHDGVHLNGEGSLVLAENFLRHLNKDDGYVNWSGVPSIQNLSSTSRVRGLQAEIQDRMVRERRGRT